MRASGPPASLEGFDDDFEFTCPASGEGKEVFEALMRDRLIEYEMHEIPRFSDDCVLIR
jgi:hypothetical protein